VTLDMVGLNRLGWFPAGTTFFSALPCPNWVRGSQRFLSNWYQQLFICRQSSCTM